MNIHNSYFAIRNPLHIIEQWLHPYKHTKTINYADKPLLISWTGRADSEFKKRTQAIIVEMQIYFSCVVQKRVLFHEQTNHTKHKVTDKLEILLRPVEAESCDPVEFAKQHPVSHEYKTNAAQKFRPAWLKLDYKLGDWHGEFGI
ncbi:MAG: hypothetical protein OEY52_11615 [Gammaproteobacteria bacterium]|nr:hypothetical protein [Gammaproteobacteria bacterium]